MALEQAFIDDCPYGPDALLLDDVLEIDVPGSRVVVRMRVHDGLPLTREQRVHPTRHPRHLNGGLMVHMTGMVGFVHAYYVLGLRHADGWIGYGAKIHEARFTALAVPDQPLILTGQATRVRKVNDQFFARYHFDFRQGEKQVYEGDQTAIWMRVQEGQLMGTDAGR